MLTLLSQTCIKSWYIEDFHLLRFYKETLGLEFEGDLKF